MSDERWRRTRTWIQQRFLADAAWYEDVMRRAAAAGMPSIDAGADTARFLQCLVQALGAMRVIEVGTLAGATTALLAKALPPGGEVVTVECDPKHADFAERIFAEAGVADRVHLRRETGLAAMRAMHAEHGDAAVDLVFLDAQRSEYIPMLPTLRAMIRPGGMLVIDNALSAGRWLPDPPPPDAPRDTMEDVCDAIRGDDAFLSTVVAVGNGALLAVRRRDR